MICSVLRLATLMAAFSVVSVSCPSSRGQELESSGAAPCRCGLACGLHGQAQACRPWEYGNPDLFYNFYVPNNCGGVPAAMYVAPLPVPENVGQTYFTYQPLMPHEFTYPHYRTYRKVYDEGRGIDRTKVVWYSNPVATVLKDVRCALKIPR